MCVGKCGNSQAWPSQLVLKKSKSKKRLMNHTMENKTCVHRKSLFLAWTCVVGEQPAAALLRREPHCTVVVCPSPEEIWDPPPSAVRSTKRTGGYSLNISLDMAVAIGRVLCTLDRGTPSASAAFVRSDSSLVPSSQIALRGSWSTYRAAEAVEAVVSDPAMATSKSMERMLESVRSV